MKEQTIGIILFVVILVSSVVLNIYVRKKFKNGDKMTIYEEYKSQLKFQNSVFYKILLIILLFFLILLWFYIPISIWIFFIVFCWLMFFVLIFSIFQSFLLKIKKSKLPNWIWVVTNIYQNWNKKNVLFWYNKENYTYEKLTQSEFDKLKNKTSTYELSIGYPYILEINYNWITYNTKNLTKPIPIDFYVWENIKIYFLNNNFDEIIVDFIEK